MASAKAPSDEIDIAFYTLGDSRKIKTLKSSFSRSKAWKYRSKTLATSTKYVFGANTNEDAIKKLEKLPKEKVIRRIYFIGHGFEGGFFFSGKPEGHDDFSANNNQILEFPHPYFFIGIEHIENLNNKKISEELIDNFASQAIAIERDNAYISVITPDSLWEVTGVVGGPDDLETFTVELSERNPKSLNVFRKEAYEVHSKSNTFIDTLISRLSKTKHIDVSFLSCYTGKSESLYRVDIVIAAKLQRKGFKDVFVGSFINNYQIVPESKSRFFDEITKDSNGKHILAPNSGVNVIPRFERLIGGLPDF